MLSMPDALVILGLLTTLIVGIMKTATKKDGAYMTKDLCAVKHESVQQLTTALTKRLDRMEDALLSQLTAIWEELKKRN
jgi:hypothetical protein